MWRAMSGRDFKEDMVAGCFKQYPYKRQRRNRPPQGNETLDPNDKLL